MSQYAREQRNDIQILSSIKTIVEKGNLTFVENILEKKADNKLRSTVEKLFQSAVVDYVRDNTGGAVSYNGLSSVRDILEPQEFGQNYWGKKIQEEIDRKRTRLMDMESRELSLVYG